MNDKVETNLNNRLSNKDKNEEDELDNIKKRADGQDLNSNQKNANKDNNSEDSISSFGTDEDFGWISYYVTLKGNEFFCQIDEDYIQDSFNLTGLANQVTYYDYALDLITDVDNEDRQELSDTQQEMVENDAEILYGLIHARFIITNRGLHAMLDKYRHREFGVCPRYNCNSQSVLPVGTTDQKNKDSIKLYCPKCEELYRPRSLRHENIDGAYFGTTFPHLFFLVFPELKPNKTNDNYVPRVFGFKLHSTWHEKSMEAARQAAIEFQQEQKRLQNSQPNKSNSPQDDDDAANNNANLNTTNINPNINSNINSNTNLNNNPNNTPSNSNSQQNSKNKINSPNNIQTSKF